MYLLKQIQKDKYYYITFNCKTRTYAIPVSIRGASVWLPHSQLSSSQSHVMEFKYKASQRGMSIPILGSEIHQNQVIK